MPLPEPHGIDVLHTYGEGFAGREVELAALGQAWSEGAVRVFVLHAEGGAGKTRVVARWLNQMRDAGWGGAGQVFVHSFYSQGSGEQRNASSEIFFEQALLCFGYPGPNLIDPTERGRTLASLILAQRGLLILDGLEPLQHPPSLDQGRLKDLAIHWLLLSLAAGRLKDSKSGGMCVVTSRQPVVELRDKEGRGVIQQPLDRLDPASGTELLRQLDVRGPEPELRQAVEDSRGHAYSLMLLGTYLRDATDDHEIWRRHEIPLLDEDKEHRYHARHLFGAYVSHLGAASAEIALLRLLGFFDRPAEEDLVTVLRTAIGTELDVLTAPLRNLSAADWRRVLRRLVDLRLIDVAVSPSPPIDSHPLLREYFAEQLREHFLQAWKAGHRRLLAHLCETAEHQPATLAGLQPLYQAVAHGCLAGLAQEAFEVYHERIQRKSLFFPGKQLGATSMDLSCIVSFFQQPWTTLRPGLSAKASMALFTRVAEYLILLGRLIEARQAMGAAHQFALANRPKKAINVLILLSELSISEGDLLAAKRYASQALLLSQEHHDTFHEVISCAAIAVAERGSGDLAAARAWFEEAETVQSQRTGGLGTLSSLQGYEYCEFLYDLASRSNSPEEKQKNLQDLESRARNCLKFGEDHNNQLIIGLAKLASSLVSPSSPQLESAVTTLRRTGDLRFLPRALTLHALALFERGARKEAATVLDEAQSLAERGPMPLLQADVHLCRARLFRDRSALAEARRLIEKHGYHRRDGELADTEAAAAHWNDKEPGMPTKIFISYSHDSEEHSQRVLALANQLRRHGVDAELDQYETRPPQGWPRWCEEQLRPENSELVLVICTATYLNRIEGKVPADEGRGVFWEGSAIYSYLYDQKGNGRFIPVLFDRKDEANIPRPLRVSTHYQLGAFDFSDAGYTALYRELTHQPAIEKPPLGEVVLLRGDIDFALSADDDLAVRPPLKARKVRSTFAPSKSDLLGELKRLPSAWFDELVFLFDADNAVSAKPAPQATRAIDLLTVVCAEEDGPDRLREEIQRLKGKRR